MMQLIRTDARHRDFIQLVGFLDEALAIADGPNHEFYAQFDTIDSIKYAVVAFVENNPAGCGAIKAFEPGIMEIKRMFVANPYRRMGLAGKILLELEKWSLELNCTHCVLETGKNNPGAIKLYEKSGYQVIENYEQYKGVATSICFQKSLKR